MHGAVGWRAQGSQAANWQGCYARGPAFHLRMQEAAALERAGSAPATSCASAPLPFSLACCPPAARCRSVARFTPAEGDAKSQPTFYVFTRRQAKQQAAEAAEPEAPRAQRPAARGSQRRGAAAAEEEEEAAPARKGPAFGLLAGKKEGLATQVGGSGTKECDNGSQLGHISAASPR